MCVGKIRVMLVVISRVFGRNDAYSAIGIIIVGKRLVFLCVNRVILAALTFKIFFFRGLVYMLITRFYFFSFSKKLKNALFELCIRKCIKHFYFIFCIYLQVVRVRRAYNIIIYSCRLAKMLLKHFSRYSYFIIRIYT